MDFDPSSRNRSSFSIRESIRTSSPSIFKVGAGVFASRTKWLSQCGQYSSLVGGFSLLAFAYRWASASPVFEFSRVFPETFLTFFAYECLTRNSATDPRGEVNLGAILPCRNVGAAGGLLLPCDILRNRTICDLSTSSGSHVRQS